MRKRSGYGQLHRWRPYPRPRATDQTVDGDRAYRLGLASPGPTRLMAVQRATRLGAVKLCMGSGTSGCGRTPSFSAINLLPVGMVARKPAPPRPPACLPSQDGCPGVRHLPAGFGVKASGIATNHRHLSSMPIRLTQVTTTCSGTALSPFVPALGYVSAGKLG